MKNKFHGKKFLKFNNNKLLKLNFEQTNQCKPIRMIALSSFLPKRAQS